MKKVNLVEKAEHPGKKLSSIKAMFDAEEKAAKHPTRTTNIRLLWETLESLRLEGCEDWSLANIGRRSEARCGLKTQSLRNSQGQRFRELIGEYVQATKVSRPKAPASNLDEILASISDVSSRTLLREMIEEGKRRKHENDMLREAIKRLSIGKAPEPSAENEDASQSAIAVIQASPRKKSHEGVIRRALDEKRLAERGMKIEKDGSIVDGNGFELFPPGFIEAIKSALK